jgi:hypothetical protein
VVIDARTLGVVDDPDHSVRANVCVLLGNVRPPTGRERLAAVADAVPTSTYAAMIFALEGVSTHLE